MSRTLSLWIAALAIVVSLLNHFHGYEAYLLGLNTTSPILNVPATAAPQTKANALTRRLTFVLLDGLGFESSQQLPTLQQYKSQAAWLPLAVEFPSYTYPGIVTYATGVPPRYSGLRLNHTKHLSHLSAHASLPTILQEASRVGYRVQIDEGDWYEFGDLLDFEKQFPRISASSARQQNEATWIYFGAIDAAGHKHGGDSDEYRSAALKADALLAKLIAESDLTQETLIFVSDHGHLPQGGHGGIEPPVLHAMFFAIGAGIAPHTWDEKTLTPYLDVVPTIAALLGASNPTSNLGEPMIEVLRASDAEKARILGSTVAQREQIERVLQDDIAPLPPNIIAQLKIGEQGAIKPAQDWLEQMTQGREDSFLAKRDSLSWHRMYWALAVTALFLFGLVWLVYQKKLSLRWSDWLPTLVYTILFWPLYHWAGYGMSWSLPRGEPGFMIETALIGAFAVNVAMWISRRSNQAQRLAEETLCMTLFFGLPYLWCSAWIGLDAAYLGDPIISFSVIFLATIGFYAHGPYGVWLLIRRWRKIPTQG